MTTLSVNVNRIALLRNSRDIGIPDVLDMARRAIAAGAHGITMHPRPDERHIRRRDVLEICGAITAPVTLEGRPTEEFLALVEEARPAAVLFVPDAPEVVTSDRGWDLAAEGDLLRPLVARAKAAGARVNLFMDPDPAALEGIEATGADGIEIYTGDYARAFGRKDEDAALRRCVEANLAARRRGLGVNGGHDLNLQNLPRLLAAAEFDENSIGHALTAEALIHGWAETIRRYLRIMREAGQARAAS